jgi:hypothetical protein
MPGTGSLIFLAFTDSLFSILPGLTASVAAAETKVGKDGAKNSSVDENSEEDGHSVTDLVLFAQAGELEICLSKMKENFFIEDPLILNGQLIQGTEKDCCITAALAKYHLNRIADKSSAERYKGGNDDLITKLTKICDSAKKLVTSFLDASKEPNYTEKQVKTLKIKLEEILKKIREINIQLMARSRVPAIHKKGPGLVQNATSTMGVAGKKSLVEICLHEAHSKIEVTKDQLKSAEIRADKAMEKQLDVNRRLQENLMMMAKFEAEGATHAQIMEVLKQGLQSFGQLKEQWTKLLSFFQVSLVTVRLG